MSTPHTHDEICQDASSPMTFAVPPSRLATGMWSHEPDRQISEGDIRASYGADRIGTGKPIRRPFNHEASRWVCVSFRPGSEAEAYRLVHPAAFDGASTTYAAKVRPKGGEDARRDPLGFYHGMIVRAGGQDLVLCGPPAQFVRGQEAQLSLF